MRNATVAGLLLLVGTSGCATTYHVLPVENPPATVRYDHGSPTTNLSQRNGAVQVTPMGLDSDGKMVFGVAAYNASNVPVNFGLENIVMRSPENKALRVYSVDDLVREARNKAIAASVAIALLGVAAAAASQAAAHQTYNSTLYTPRGAYHYRATYYDAGQAAAGTALAIGGASAGIYAVNRSLDGAIAGIGQSMLQTTTIDPGESVAGRVLVQRPRGGKYPQEVTMLVQWNGEDYPLRFQVTKGDGRNAVPARPVVAATVPSEPVVQEDAPADPPLPPPELEARPLGSKPPPSPAPEPQPLASSPPPEPVPAPTPAAPPVAVTAPPPIPRKLSRKEEDDAYNRRMWEEQARYGQ